MSPEQFAYWLQGFFEMRDADPESASKPLSPEQVKVLREHLGKVLKHVPTKELVATLEQTAPCPFILPTLIC